MDAGKPRMELIPASALVSLGFILGYGAEKYEPDGWQDVEPDRYVGALLRHLAAHMDGEVFDEESGFRHLEHVLCNAAFLNHLFRGDEVT